MAYENELETWWAGMPSEIRSVFGFIYDKADELLKAVAGDPDDLMRAGSIYANIGPQITGIGAAIRSDAASLSGAWDGEAYTSFMTKVGQLEQTTRSTGDATAQTLQILQAAAQAAVDGANTIVDIVVTVIEFALGTLALAAATALISLGASFVAWAATEAAEGALALVRIFEVVGKVAQVLEKIAQILTKIAQVMEKIAEIFMDWARFVKGLKLLPKTFDGAGISAYLSDRVVKALITQADHLVQMPTVPSGVTHGIPSVVGDVGDLNDDVNAAQDAG